MGRELISRIDKLLSAKLQEYSTVQNLIKMYFAAEDEKRKVWDELKQKYDLDENTRYTVTHSKKPKLYKVTESDSA